MQSRLIEARKQVARTPLALLFFGASLLTLAWLYPPLAIVVAWPFLVVVPGWLLVARVAPSIGLPGRLGIGVVASVFVSAHLVDVLSLIVGFHPWTVLIAAWLLLAATLALATLRLRWLAPAPALDGLPARARRAVSEYRGAWFLAALSGFVVSLILFVGGWHDSSHGWIAGGWNWSDLLVHVSIGQSLIDGNFPPQVPYFAGVPLTYHWFGDFHGAILASVSGVDLITVFFLSNGVLAATLVLLVWQLALGLTGERRVAYIAAILALFGGGMGWIRLPGDFMAGNGDPLTLLTNNPYDNTWAAGWPFFKIASVLGTGFGPHRATAYGLPGLIAIALLASSSFGRHRAGVLTAGVLAALLAPFHFYFFPASYLIVGLYWLTSRGWRMDKWLADVALFLAPVVLAIPFIAAGALPARGPGLVQARHRLVRGAASRGPARGGVLLPHESRPAARPGDDRGRLAQTAAPRLALHLGAGALPDTQLRRGERGRLRHEQVFPGHVDRPGDPERVAHPPLAAARSSPRSCSSAASRRPWSASGR